MRIHWTKFNTGILEISEISNILPGSTGYSKRWDRFPWNLIRFKE
jgi:hypothetical protein